MLLGAPICVPDWGFLRAVGSQAIEAVLNVDVDGRLIHRGPVIIKDLRIVVGADSLLERFEGWEVLSWRARPSAGAIDLSLRRPPPAQQQMLEQPWGGAVAEDSDSVGAVPATASSPTTRPAAFHSGTAGDIQLLLKALGQQHPPAAGASELLVRFLLSGGGAPTQQLSPPAAAQLLLQSLSRSQPPSQEHQQRSSSHGPPFEGEPELPCPAALAGVAALPQRPSALQRILLECGGRKAANSPSPAVSTGQARQQATEQGPLGRGAAITTTARPAPTHMAEAQTGPDPARPAASSGPSSDPDQLAEMLRVLQRLQGVVQTQLAAAQQSGAGALQGLDPEPVVGAASEARAIQPTEQTRVPSSEQQTPSMKRVASTLSAAGGCVPEEPGAEPAAAQLQPLPAPGPDGEGFEAQASRQYCANAAGSSQGAVSGWLCNGSDSTGSAPASPAVSQQPSTTRAAPPPAAVPAATGAGGPGSCAVVVACPARSLSRYLTKAELAMLAGPEVFSSLCSGGKLTGVRVQFEVNGRRLPEVYAADIERYSPSSPFYLKASACPGVGGLPWRAIPADATVQWKRLADNTLVLAQVPDPTQRCACDWQASEPRPPKRHAIDSDAAPESDTGEDPSVYGGGCSTDGTDDEARGSEAKHGRRHKRMRSCSPPAVRGEVPAEELHGQGPCPALAAHTLEAGTAALDELPAAAGALGVLTTAQRRAKCGAAAGCGGFSPRIVASNLYVGRRQLEQLYGPGFKPNIRSDMQLCVDGALQPQLFSVQWREGCHKGSFYPRGAPLAQLRGRFLQAIHWLDPQAKRLVFEVRDTPPADWAGQRRTQAKPGSVGLGSSEVAAARGSGGGGSQASSGLSQSQDEEAPRGEMTTGPSFSSGITSPCPPAADGCRTVACSTPLLGSAAEALSKAPGSKPAAFKPAVLCAEAPRQLTSAAPAVAAVMVAAPLPQPLPLLPLPPPAPGCMWLAPAVVSAPQPPPLGLQAVFASRAAPTPQPARLPSPPQPSQPTQPAQLLALQPQPRPGPLLPTAVAPFSSRERALREVRV